MYNSVRVHLRAESFGEGQLPAHVCTPSRICIRARRPALIASLLVYKKKNKKRKYTTAKLSIKEKADKRKTSAAKGSRAAFKPTPSPSASSSPSKKKNLQPFSTPFNPFRRLKRLRGL